MRKKVIRGESDRSYLTPRVSMHLTAGLFLTSVVALFYIILRK